MCLSPSVGVKKSLVIKAKLPLLPDRKGRKSEEAAKESGRDKEERKRVLLMKREINGGFNFGLACWTARREGGISAEHEDADRLDRVGVCVHKHTETPGTGRNCASVESDDLDYKRILHRQMIIPCLY